MSRTVRKILKGFMWAFLVIVLLFALQVSVLAYPAPWFDGMKQKENLSLYYREANPTEMEALLDDVLFLIQDSEVYQEDVQLRVFVCPSQGLYNLFARLSRVPTSVPGFNLSLLNNSFVSIPRLEARAATNQGRVAHSAIVGDLPHSIAHELIHDFVQERIGFMANIRLPRWKSEGYAEYAASRAATRQDPQATLARRIEILQEDLASPGARDYYEGALIVEYLAEKRGYTFDEIMSDGVTRETARAQLFAWYEDQR